MIIMPFIKHLLCAGLDPPPAAWEELSKYWLKMGTVIRVSSSTLPFSGKIPTASLHEGENVP